MVTGIMTGMRIDEMLTTLRTDLDLEGAQLTVRGTKGRRDERIPLFPVVVEHLRQIKDFSRVLFDWPLEKRNIYPGWHRIQEEAGIHLECHEDHEHTPSCHFYGFHSLKKACGTLNAARLPKIALQAFMRHRSSSTTERYYINKDHVVAKHLDDVFVPASAVSKSG